MEKDDDDGSSEECVGTKMQDRHLAETMLKRGTALARSSRGSRNRQQRWQVALADSGSRSRCTRTGDKQQEQSRYSRGIQVSLSLSLTHSLVGEREDGRRRSDGERLVKDLCLHVYAYVSVRVGQHEWKAAKEQIRRCGCSGDQNRFLSPHLHSPRLSLSLLSSFNLTHTVAAAFSSLFLPSSPSSVQA